MFPVCACAVVSYRTKNIFWETLTGSLPYMFPHCCCYGALLSTSPSHPNSPEQTQLKFKVRLIHCMLVYVMMVRSFPLHYITAHHSSQSVPCYSPWHSLHAKNNYNLWLNSDLLCYNYMHSQDNFKLQTIRQEITYEEMDRKFYVDRNGSLRTIT